MLAITAPAIGPKRTEHIIRAMARTVTICPGIGPYFFCSVTFLSGVFVGPGGGGGGGGSMPPVSSCVAESLLRFSLRLIYKVFLLSLSVG